MRARPGWLALFGGFFSAAVVSGWISRWHRDFIPVTSAPVVSFATVHGYHPLANLPPYVAGLVLAIGVPLGLSRFFPSRPIAPGAFSVIPFPVRCACWWALRPPHG